MNLVVLTGRLTADPELKYTQSGKAYAKVRLAVQKDFKNEKGEYEADFINLVAWDKKAELISEYMRKGQKAGFQGKLRVRNYEDENKQKRTITEVAIDAIEFMESKSKSSGGHDGYAPEPEPEVSGGDDDFPF